MEKQNKNTMELNRETALRLWNKRFGKNIKALDFAGREIAKGSYNDRNSKFGWNVDHILPQCKGGVTAEHNLEIVNIKTNDEKANKFPGFVANGKNFTIVKVENHYEIKLASKSSSDKTSSNNGGNEDNGNVSQNNNKGVDDECNFFDSAAGIRFYKDLKGVQNKKIFVGTVQIKLRAVQNTAIIDFIEEIFSEEHIAFKVDNNFYLNPKSLIITIRNYNHKTKASIDELLDKCILLNTYLKHYFCPLKVIDDYSIKYQVDDYQDKKDFLYDNNSSTTIYNESSIYYVTSEKEKLKINRLVIINSSASKNFNVNDLQDNKYYNYDYIYTKLSEDLKKEVKGK